MKHRLLFSLLTALTCAALSLQAQTATISDEIPFRSEDQFEILGKINDHILVFRDNPFARQLIAYDQNLQIGWEKEIELQGDKTKIAGYIQYRDQFGVVYTRREAGEVFCHLQLFDGAGNVVDTAEIYNFGKQYYTPRPKLFLSDNNRQLIVYTLQKDSDVSIISYDLHKKRVNWVSQFKVPTYLSFQRNFEKALVTNAGQFFMIFSRFNRKSKAENHLYEIHQFTSNSPLSVIHKIGLGGKLTYDVSFEYDNINQQVIGGGLYSEVNVDRTEGMFYLTFKPFSGGVFQIDFHGFPKPFLQTVLGKYYKKKDFLTDVAVRQTVLRKDGGLIVIGEVNKLFERFSSNGSRSFSGSNYVIDYFYENMFVYAFNPDGTIHWQTILHKKQVSQDDDAKYSSFFLAKTRSSLRLLYNDDIRLGATVSAYTLTATGSVRRSSILSTKNQKIKLRFQDALQVAADEILVPSDYRSQFKLVRIKG